MVVAASMACLILARSSAVNNLPFSGMAAASSVAVAAPFAAGMEKVCAVVVEEEEEEAGSAGVLDEEEAKDLARVVGSPLSVTKREAACLRSYETHALTHSETECPSECRVGLPCP